MSTLPNRPNTALLVIDVQNAVVAQAWDRDAVIQRIAGLVSRARRAEVPVVWIQQVDDQLPEGSDAWRIVPELEPAPGEAMIGKRYGDAFEETDLGDTLARLAVGRLLVSGAQTDQCVRSTLHGSLVRGYDTFLVSDAHTTEDNTEWGAPPPELVISHTNAYWTYEEAPGREAGTVESSAVSFG